MKTFSFTVSDYLFECFEKYHIYYNAKNTRTLDDTISVLLNYVLGYTTNISHEEIGTIEYFFEKNKDILYKILEWVLVSGYNPDKFY